MANCAPGSVDIVIVDSTDPVGPAEGLFNKAFYDSCFRALKDDGILVQQSESPLVLLDLIKEMRARDGQGRLHHVQDPAVPAAVLPDRLVELHAGAQGPAASSSARPMRAPRRSTRSTTAPTSTAARWRCRRSWPLPWATEAALLSRDDAPPEGASGHNPVLAAHAHAAPGCGTMPHRPVRGPAGRGYRLAS